MANYSKGGHWTPTIHGCVCEHCKVTFVGRKKNPRFCSKSCSSKATARRVAHTDRTCPFCSKKWSAPETNPSTFCSRDCWSKAQVEKRRRDCQICGTEFYVEKAGRAGLTCSPKCLSVKMSQNATGRKASDERRQKMSSIMKDKFSDPEYAQRHKAVTSDGLKKWLSEPANAEKMAKLSSERMRRRHADPEWQKVRDARSSRVMKENWQRYRAEFTQMAVDRYASGLGIASEESELRKRAATKWIMTQASNAMHEKTEYNEVYAEVQARIRQEHPFVPGDDYHDYCRWLGREVVGSPECRAIADAFMSKAIPMFAQQWQNMKSSA